MFCRNCGKSLKDSAKFCSSCGVEVLKKEESKEIEDLNQEVKKPNTQNLKNNKKMIYTGQQSESLRNTLLLEQAKITANGEIVKGLVFCGLGLLVTVISYFLAGEGGSYFLWWGSVIYGGYAFLRGLYWKANPKKLIAKIQDEENS